jgi:hypothetical protein
VGTCVTVFILSFLKSGNIIKKLKGDTHTDKAELLFLIPFVLMEGERRRRRRRNYISDTVSYCIRNT